MTWTDIRRELPPLGVDLLVKWRVGRITAAIARAPFMPGQKLYFDPVGVVGNEWEWEWDLSHDPYDGVTHWRLMVEGPAP